MRSDIDAERAATATPEGLLVVTVDRLPAWMLPAFGATWVAAPCIDALAARGIVFDRAITPSTDAAETLRDLAGAGAQDGPALVRIAAALGWNPVLVTDDDAAATAFASDTGMEVVLVAAAAARDEAADAAATAAARLVAAALEAIRSGRHRMVWCHCASLGVVWDAPRRYRDRYVDPEDPPPPMGAGVPAFAVGADTDPDLIVGVRQAFAGQVSLLDAEIGRLFVAVLGGTNGRGAEAVSPARWSVLLLGVRGMPLGLHGWVGTGGPDVPHGELVHVPAILVDAGGRMAAQRYGGLVVPADFGSTLAEFVAGGEPRRTRPDPDAPWLGASLAGLLEDWSAVPRDRVVASGADAAAIITPRWHCLSRRAGAEGEAARPLLFAKPDDFFEVTDVADRCPDVAEPLADVFARAAAGDRRALWRAVLPAAAPA